MKQHVSWTFAGDISVYLAVKEQKIYWVPSTVRTPPPPPYRYYSHWLKVNLYSVKTSFSYLKFYLTSSVALASETPFWFPWHKNDY